MKRVLSACAVAARWLLAALLALPTTGVLYLVFNPPSLLDELTRATSRLYSMTRQIETMTNDLSWVFSGQRPVLVGDTVIVIKIDYGQYLLLFAFMFGVLALLFRWRGMLPLLFILAVPIFEGARNFRLPASYTAETAAAWWLWQALISPFTIGIFMVVIVWRLLIHRRMRRRIGWRWMMATAGITLVVVSLILFGPARILIDPHTSQHPGTAWLAALLLTWLFAAWMVWKLGARSEAKVDAEAAQDDPQNEVRAILQRQIVG